MAYELVRHIPENERPKEAPIPPKPTCITVDAGTEEEWTAYHTEAAAYYDGVVLRKVD